MNQMQSYSEDRNNSYSVLYMVVKYRYRIEK